MHPVRLTRNSRKGPDEGQKGEKKPTEKKGEKDVRSPTLSVGIMMFRLVSSPSSMLCVHALPTL